MLSASSYGNTLGYTPLCVLLPYKSTSYDSFSFTIALWGECKYSHLTMCEPFPGKGVGLREQK